MIDKLIESIKKTNNPTCVGLDTCVEYLPQSMQQKCITIDDCTKYITEFNFQLIDTLCQIVPSVKVQVAYYEMYGYKGIKAFSDTLQYAKSKGLFTIADVKRNDIGSTAGAYSKAYLAGTQINSQFMQRFDADFITVNGYLGSDGITPFVEDIKAFDKGMFVLVKTSNPSSFELQDKTLSTGEKVYESVAKMVEGWGKGCIGKYGYSDVGAVVGATHKAEAEEIRKLIPNTFFLIPGYGSQGGTASDLSVCFDANGLGGIVNNSRGIICAHTKEKFKGQSYFNAAYNAAVEMQLDLNKNIKF